MLDCSSRRDSGIALRRPHYVRDQQSEGLEGLVTALVAVAQPVQTLERVVDADAYGSRLHHKGLPFSDHGGGINSRRVAVPGSAAVGQISRKGS